MNQSSLVLAAWREVPSRMFCPDDFLTLKRPTSSPEQQAEHWHLIWPSDSTLGRENYPLSEFLTCSNPYIDFWIKTNVPHSPCVNTKCIGITSNLNKTKMLFPNLRCRESPHISIPDMYQSIHWFLDLKKLNPLRIPLWDCSPSIKQGCSPTFTVLGHVQESPFELYLAQLKGSRGHERGREELCDL